MKLSKLLCGIPLAETIQQDLDITGIAYDSRRVTSGNLFVCVKGYQTDGHKYIDSAIKNGAIAILAQDECIVPEGTVVYHAEDTRKGLAMAAANFYDHPEQKLSIIGVTGTNGKTTVTTLVKSILEFSGKKVGLIGTNAIMIGDTTLPSDRTTPESLELFELFNQMVTAGISHVVMEVSSHSLFLHRVYGIQFAVGAFTNLTQDHLDFHKTMENYFEAKRMLFSVCDNAVINADDAYGKRLTDLACPGASFAIDSAADFTASNLRISPRGTIFDVTYLGKTYPVRLGIPGKFSVYNALTAFAIAIALGIPTEKIIDALLVANGVCGRAEIVYTPKTDFTVIIDYAHTPDGLDNIIKTVREFAKGRVVTLFGCGGDRDPIKRPIMGEVAGSLSDFCIVTSDNPRTEDPMSIIEQILVGIQKTDCAYVVIENRREAIRYAIENAQPDDCIILAGKGHETYQIIGKEKRHFDEREVIQDILAERNQA